MNIVSMPSVNIINTLSTKHTSMFMFSRYQNAEVHNSKKNIFPKVMIYLQKNQATLSHGL